MHIYTQAQALTPVTIYPPASEELRARVYSSSSPKGSTAPAEP